jgi:hypothetical protein
MSQQDQNPTSEHDDRKDHEYLRKEVDDLKNKGK